MHFDSLRYLWVRYGCLIACTIVVACICVSITTGCSRHEPSTTQAEELRVIESWGMTGRSPGQFVYPRAMDSFEDLIYIIDKTGRVQKLDASGTPVLNWRLPKYDRGYPTGISVHPQSGNVYVADTHEHRILMYSPTGELLRSFGEYGEEPGQMIYPTDVAFGPDDTLFVSEYGGNDRIQCFDMDGTPLYRFGSFGPGIGEYNRPQAMVYDADRNQLLIADACNHRIVIVKPDGSWIGSIAQCGTGAGDLSYPYGIKMLEDGSVLVSEFGNSRVQHLSLTGMCLGLYGMYGSESGNLKAPWTLTIIGERLYILDSLNDRVQVISRP